MSNVITVEFGSKTTKVGRCNVISFPKLEEPVQLQLVEVDPEVTEEVEGVGEITPMGADMEAGDQVVCTSLNQEVTRLSVTYGRQNMGLKDFWIACHETGVLNKNRRNPIKEVKTSDIMKRHGITERKNSYPKVKHERLSSVKGVGERGFTFTFYSGTDYHELKVISKEGQVIRCLDSDSNNLESVPVKLPSKLLVWDGCYQAYVCDEIYSLSDRQKEQLKQFIEERDCELQAA